MECSHRKSRGDREGKCDLLSAIVPRKTLKLIYIGTKYGAALEVLYPPIVLLTKLSILFQFIQIFIPSRHGYDYRLVQCIMWINGLYFTACFFISVFQCTPRSKIWDPEINGHCVNYQVYVVVTAVFNVISDVTMLLLPLIWIWRLQMSNKRKLGISAVFATGVLYDKTPLVSLYLCNVDSQQCLCDEHHAPLRQYTEQWEPRFHI